MFTLIDMTKAAVQSSLRSKLHVGTSVCVCFVVCVFQDSWTPMFEVRKSTIHLLPRNYDTHLPGELNTHNDCTYVPSVAWSTTRHLGYSNLGCTV